MDVRRLLTILLFVVPAGCGSGTREVPPQTMSDTVRMAVAWSIAPGVHPVADSLGDVSGVAQDADGNVYVSDFLTATIWVFDADGRYVHRFGRKGEGPGEFDSPTGPALGPDGRLFIRDVSRVSVFGRDPETGLLTRLDTTFSGPVYPDWTSTRVTRFDSTGSVLYPGRVGGDGTALNYFIRFAADGTTDDTIFVPSYPTQPPLTAFVRTSPGGGRMLSGLNHTPFAPLPVWDVTPQGSLISGDGISYRLVETAADGSTVTVFQRDELERRIPSEQRRDSIDALRARIDSLEAPLDRIEGVPDEVWSLEVPEVFPAYQAVYVGDAGGVWVRRWPADGAERTVSMSSRGRASFGIQSSWISTSLSSLPRCCRLAACSESPGTPSPTNQWSFASRRRSGARFSPDPVSELLTS